MAMRVARRMIKDREWRDRLFRAFLLRQLRAGGELTQEWLAASVSRELRLKEPLTQSAVSRWFKGAVPRDLATIIAIAKLLGVDPGWLAFGSASQAPPPTDGPQARYLPPPED